MGFARVSTIIRLRPETLAWAKQRARREQKSFNAYVENLIERQRPLLPKLPMDFGPSPEIEAMTIGQWREPSHEELESDPRLAHILGYGK